MSGRMGGEPPTSYPQCTYTSIPFSAFQSSKSNTYLTDSEPADQEVLDARGVSVSVYVFVFVCVRVCYVVSTKLRVWTRSKGETGGSIRGCGGRGMHRGCCTSPSTMFLVLPLSLPLLYCRIHSLLTLGCCPIFLMHCEAISSRVA
jgi:hypothetical protein